MTDIVKRFAALALVGVFTLGLGACQTIEGAGEDVESVGQEIDETANEAEDAIDDDY